MTLLIEGYLPIKTYFNSQIINDKEVFTGNEKGRLPSEGKLKIGVTPYEQWRKEFLERWGDKEVLKNARDIELSVFVYPYEEPERGWSYYEDPFGFHKLMEDIRKRSGETVMMGDLPHLKIYRQKEAEVSLEPWQLYHVLATADPQRDTGRFLINRRAFMTGRLHPIGLLHYAPDSLTLEEYKFMVLERIGITPEEARKKELKAILDNTGDLIWDGPSFTFTKEIHETVAVSWDSAALLLGRSDNLEEVRQSISKNF